MSAAVEPLVTARALCAHLGVSDRTLRYWRDQGMPHYAQAGTVRFRISEVETWMRSDHPDAESAERMSA